MLVYCSASAAIYFAYITLANNVLIRTALQQPTSGRQNPLKNNKLFPEKKLFENV
jgi:hypothetical protein